MSRAGENRSCAAWAAYSAFTRESVLWLMPWAAPITPLTTEAAPPEKPKLNPPECVTVLCVVSTPPIAALMVTFLPVMVVAFWLCTVLPVIVALPWAATVVEPLMLPAKVPAALVWFTVSVVVWLSEPIMALRPPPPNRPSVVDVWVYSYR